jgi:hypothetical protein
MINNAFTDVFETPALGGQASVSLTGAYGVVTAFPKLRLIALEAKTLAD